jgi:hypothetical protein
VSGHREVDDRGVRVSDRVVIAMHEHQCRRPHIATGGKDMSDHQGMVAEVEPVV